MPANRQRLKSARVCPSRCECIYNDRRIKKHVYVPSTRQRPPTLLRRILELPPRLFLPAQAEGLLPLATSLSLGPPCHGRLPSAIDSLGPLCGFWPLRQSQDPAIAGESHISHTRAMCSLPFWWVSMASLCWNAVGGTCILRNTSHHGGLDGAALRICALAIVW